MSLATKYRPKTFEEVTEQSITTTILKRQLERRTFKNAYLFAGTSGCGKTTCARIFANKINSGIGQPIEVDGGSAGNVEDIRAIIELAKQRDLVGEYKVIIIDECQNLGGGRKENSPAWSALLKCIEECPKYTIFIFCSTDPEKIPMAILNRLQRYNFAPISQEGIKARLDYICEQEGFTNYDKVCDLISKYAHGGMRDAITYLEQVADYDTNLSLEAASSILGGLSYETMFKLTWALQNHDDKEVMMLVEKLYNDGQNLKSFLDAYLEFTINLSKYILFKNIELTNIPAYLATPENAVVQFTVEKEGAAEYFNKLADYLFKVKSMIQYDTNCKTTILMSLVRLARGL